MKHTIKLYELVPGTVFLYTNENGKQYEGVFLGCDSMYGKVQWSHVKYTSDLPFDHFNCNVKVFTYDAQIAMFAYHKTGKDNHRIAIVVDEQGKELPIDVEYADWLELPYWRPSWRS